MTLAMCVMYVLIWTPYAVVAFIFCFHPYNLVPMWVTVIAPHIAKASCVSNPIVYFLLVKRVRKELQEMWYELVCLHDLTRHENRLRDEQTLPQITSCTLSTAVQGVCSSNLSNSSG